MEDDVNSEKWSVVSFKTVSMRQHWFIDLFFVFRAFIIPNLLCLSLLSREEQQEHIQLHVGEKKEKKKKNYGEVSEAWGKKE